MRFAAVARVTETRWIACEVHDELEFGLKPGGELTLATTLCNEIRASGEPIIIDHVAEDAAFCGHPTPAMYGFQSYISLPIRRRDGSFFGTLCAIDPRPARLKTPEIIGMFSLFADLIAFHLDARDRLAASEAALLDARETAELREQFIAVLGHDLRNPLASIDAGVRLLRRAGPDEKAMPILDLIESSVTRMAGLINDVMDLAHGRLRGGLALDRISNEALGPALEQVIAELRTAWPERAIEADIALPRPIRCDAARLAQLLSNLLANALTHGTAERPVSVRALVRDGQLELSVANSGKPIPPATMARLFQPFFRASSHANRDGLGLGLYIASEIAQAHGGRLDVTSTAEETRFTLRMPAG